MTFDGLYGEGARAQLESLLNSAGGSKSTLAEFPVGTDAVRVNVTWGTSVLKMECRADRVHFLTLRTGKDIPTGLYTALCSALPSVFKAWSVVKFTCSPADSSAEAILKTRGSWSNKMDWVL